jgi:uncharacterized iron-regulated membrane protein
MRSFHRITSILVAMFALYLGVTGTLIQSLDLRTLWTHPPATEPNLQAIRESINGPPNYQVISDRDYAAEPLPRGFNPGPPLSMGFEAARTQLGSISVRYIELRMSDGRPIVQVRSADRLLSFDSTRGEFLPGRSEAHLNPVPAQSQNIPSPRSSIKGLHRMTAFGDLALWINVIVGLALSALIFTGLAMYFQLLRARYRQRGAMPFWYAGGWWRTLHRGIAVLAALFILIATLSGFVLAIDSLGHGIYLAHQRAIPGAKEPRFADASSPLAAAQIPTMLQTTLGAFRGSEPETSIRVIRLRYFAGMAQGVIITGESEPRQLVYNSTTGRRVSMTEPGYPATGQPFGWHEHQLMKQIHRGDWLGMPGRAMDLIAGLSMIFLSVSGVAMYLNQWIRRRRSGRAGFLWT